MLVDEYLKVFEGKEEFPTAQKCPLGRGQDVNCICNWPKAPKGWVSGRVGLTCIIVCYISQYFLYHIPVHICFVIIQKVGF